MSDETRDDNPFEAMLQRLLAVAPSEQKLTVLRGIVKGMLEGTSLQLLERVRELGRLTADEQRRFVVVLGAFDADACPDCGGHHGNLEFVVLSDQATFNADPQRRRALFERLLADAVGQPAAGAHAH